jgi:ankyrin repeat protein
MTSKEKKSAGKSQKKLDAELLEACKNRGSTAESISALLTLGASARAKDRHGYTPLHKAASHNPDAVPILIAAGADPNGMN